MNLKTLGSGVALVALTLALLVGGGQRSALAQDPTATLAPAAAQAQPAGEVDAEEEDEGFDDWGLLGLLGLGGLAGLLRRPQTQVRTYEETVARPVGGTTGGSDINRRT